ncbi:hypothetical protein GE09DRAFT_775229 [Coniochaeta sp. 2T2.1]|nr:hypothetical protein GE09DRAFT_775229 [Coniochaeta sp. 2T2.1]
MAILRYVPAILDLAALVTAAPAPTKTASPNCVTGEPAVPFPYPDGSFPVTGYATVTPLASHGSAIDKPTHYQLLPAWRNAHDIFGGQDDGPSHITIAGPADAYTAMKCQYKCNQYDRCVAYFVTNDGGPCIFLDAIIDPALFVYDQYAEPFGGYNLLCNPPPNPFNGPSTTLENRQDMGYKPDGTSPTPVNIAGRQDRGYKLDGSAPTAAVSDGRDSRMVKGDGLTLLLPHPTHPAGSTRALATAGNDQDKRLLLRPAPTHVARQGRGHKPDGSTSDGTVESRQDRGCKPDGSASGHAIEDRQDRGYKPDGSSSGHAVRNRQDRGYKPDGSIPDVTVESRQDRGYKPGSSNHSLIEGVSNADNCTETHVAPMQSWVNYAPSADFTTKHGHYTVS